MPRRLPESWCLEYSRFVFPTAADNECCPITSYQSHRIISTLTRCHFSPLMLSIFSRMPLRVYNVNLKIN